MGGQGSIRPANLRISNSSTHIRFSQPTYIYNTSYNTYIAERGKLPPRAPPNRAPPVPKPLTTKIPCRADDPRCTHARLSHAPRLHRPIPTPPIPHCAVPICAHALERGEEAAPGRHEADDRCCFEEVVAKDSRLSASQVLISSSGVESNPALLMRRCNRLQTALVSCKNFPSLCFFAVVWAGRVWPTNGL